MKILVLAMIGLLSSHAWGNEALRWTCTGTETETEKPVSFDFVLADHDGVTYTYKALENVVENGEVSPDIDLNITQVFVGRTMEALE